MSRRRTNTSSILDTSAATTGGAAVVSSHDNVVMSNNTPKSDYVHYLLSYEGMVRHQDLEFDATSGHMKNMFERSQILGGKNIANGESNTRAAVEDSPRGMLTYLQMRRCLLRVGVNWNRSLHPRDADYDDDVSEFGGQLGKNDIIATDSQLIMLLKKLVETEETYRAAKMMPEGGDRNQSRSKNAKYQLDQGLFLPEFTQAYKLITGGMHSLKSISNADVPAESDLRDRLKERTLEMMVPFGPHSEMHDDAPRNARDGDDAPPRAKRPPRGDAGGESTRRDAKPGYSNDDVNKLMCSKDVVLSRIMENHESEMSALTSNMELMRLGVQRTQVALKKRRRRLRWLVAIVGAILTAASIGTEVRRREFLENQIAVGREAERIADAKTIAGLTAKKLDLEKELNNIEGKVRYQVNHNNDIEAQTQGIQKQLDDIDMKELIQQAEIEHCFASQAESTEDLKREQSEKEEGEEELVWCRSRLQSRERELNELEHVSEGGGEIAMVAKSIEGDEAATGRKPVYLEMKYNRSIRRAMFRRQTYSAVAGFAASALLQALAPSVVKLFAPKAAIVLPLPPVKRVRNRVMEMLALDGISGSTVAFLLVQALGVFLMPL